MILQFRGEYAFLSNFTKLEAPIVYRGVSYPTVEHFYQAMKTLDKDERIVVVKHPSKGLKRYSKTLQLRDDWEDVKRRVMWAVLKHKFSEHNPVLRAKLKATRDCYIQEGNWWGDTYWGVDLRTGEGENVLGKMLIKIRDKL